MSEASFDVSKTRKQVVLFIFIGTLNTLFSYGVYSFFIFIGFNYIFSSAISFFFGTLFSFITLGKIVFNMSNYKLIKKFILVYMFIYFTYIFFIKIVYLLSNNLYLSGIISIVFVASLSFILNKYFIFSKT